MLNVSLYVCEVTHNILINYYYCYYYFINRVVHKKLYQPRHT